MSRPTVTVTVSPTPTPPTPSPPAASGAAQDRILARLALVLFVGFLCIGLPLPVIPLFVKHSLGFNDVAVGASVGIQFLATVLTRGYAGRLADQRGGKHATMQGAMTCACAGAIYVVAALLPVGVGLKLAVLIVGRLVLGLGESRFVTGILTWGISSVSQPRAGKAISWSGMAMYGSLAAGAPIGVALYQAGGFLLVSVAALAVPLLAALIAFGAPAAVTFHGDRVPLFRVLKLIWRSGLSLALQGVGFATIGAFASLYFASRGWAHVGLGMTCFGGAFALVRLLFGHLPGRLGGFRVAMGALTIECIGQALLWLAPNETTALVGALVTGLGCSLVFPGLGIEALKLVPPHSRGTAMGGFAAFQDVAYGVTGPLTGVLAAGYGYPSVFLVGAIGAALGVAMTVVARAQARRVLRP
jgi:MFS family permease